MQAVFNGTVRIKDHVAFWHGVQVRRAPAEAEQ